VLDERVRGVGQLQPGELAGPEAVSVVPVGAQRQGGRGTALPLDPLDDIGAAGEPARTQNAQLEQAENTYTGEPGREQAERAVGQVAIDSDCVRQAERKCGNSERVVDPAPARIRQPQPPTQH
jgi:hypothetical protein